MHRKVTLLISFVLFFHPAFALAQGLLVVENTDNSAERVRLPRPPSFWPPQPRPVPPLPPPAKYSVKKLDVQARLIDQAAQVQVSQTFVNSDDRDMEVSFVFPLPYDGAVEQMTLLIDGKEHPAKLLDAGEARRMYEEIVRRNRDPALLEWLGAGLFRTSVFPLSAGASRTVVLRYSQLLRKHEGLTEFLFPLSAARYTSEAPESVSLRATIESDLPIKNIYSPTHAVTIERPDDRRATIVHTTKGKTPTADFRLFYDVGPSLLGARVLSYRPSADRDGYFLLLATPEIKIGGKKPVEKTVLMVIDRSGSMSGRKIEQARGALKHVLNNLQPGDLFNIVAYDSEVQMFKPELQRLDGDTLRDAIGFAEGLYAGGSTDIDAALRTAFGQLQDPARPSYVFFLTDGLPTAGETNESQIVADARKYNRARARLFAFGAGYDVNSRLLDRLARENFGQSEYVRPEENIEDRISRLYNRVESPVMTDVGLRFVFDAADESPSRSASIDPINRVYPKMPIDLFAGEQLAVVGRYRIAGAAKAVIEGTLDKRPQTIDFPAALVEKSADDSFAFIEKVWAVRRVGEIIDELDLKGHNDELVKEMVELAVRHGILTPYTSFMADEGVDLYDASGNAAKAGGRLRALGEASGAGGFAQRKLKGRMKCAQQAPSSPTESMLDAHAGAAASLPFAGDAQRESRQAAANVRNIGDRTFFRRDGQWIDSQLTAEQVANARRIKQFSDAYFELAAAHGRRLSQYMIFDEPVLLAVEGQAYLIEP